MWNEIADEKDLFSFMKLVNSFHDSCIKEIKYTSGAYVDEKLSMYPVNDQRILKVIIQRQYNEYPMIELEFRGLKYLKLFPVDDRYTCEILDSTMLLSDNCVYWADCGEMSIEDVEHHSGTIICASKLRWRSINGYMGKDVFFTSPI